MKLTSFMAIIALATTVVGCATAPEPKSDSAATATAPKEEKCRVTGSNLPKRDCLSDVKILPPSAADTVLPQLPRTAPGS